MFKASSLAYVSLLQLICATEQKYKIKAFLAWLGSYRFLKWQYLQAELAALYPFKDGFIALGLTADLKFLSGNPFISKHPIHKVVAAGFLHFCPYVKFTRCQVVSEDVSLGQRS